MEYWIYSKIIFCTYLGFLIIDGRVLLALRPSFSLQFEETVESFAASVMHWAVSITKSPTRLPYICLCSVVFLTSIVVKRVMVFTVPTSRLYHSHAATIKCIHFTHYCIIYLYMILCNQLFDLSNLSQRRF